MNQTTEQTIKGFHEVGEGWKSLTESLRLEIERLQKEVQKTIDQRDRSEEAADKLSDAILGYFGLEFGNHHNQEGYWAEALELILSKTPNQPSGKNC